MTTTSSHEALRVACEAIVRGSQGLCRWNWDASLGAALTVFSAAESDVIRGHLERALRGKWDYQTVAKAPPLVSGVISRLGGIRAGQYLLGSDLTDGAMVFGAWWPWSGGKSVSLRIGAVSSNEPATAELTRELQAWFGLSSPA